MTASLLMARKKTNPQNPRMAQVAVPPHQPLLDKDQSIPAVLVFLISFALYVATMAPTVTLIDSGELIVAAKTLGIAHPPGVPLYVLLAHAATWLPIGNIAVRVNLLSALFAALSAGMLTLLTAEVLRVVSRESPDRARGSIAGKIVGWLPPAAAGLLFAVSRTLWSYATVAEVYTLNTFLILTTFFAVFRWRRIKAGATSQHRLQDRWLNAAAILFGLSLCVHHVTAGLTLPALAFLVLSTEGRRFLISKRLARTALWSVLGLAPYIYLPIAASSMPLFNWGNPSTFRGFWRHITGWQYQVFFQDSQRVLREGFEEFFGFLFREFGPPWFPAAILCTIFGLWATYKLDKKILVFIILIVVFNLAYSLNYEIAEDKESYYLPTFTAASLAFGIGSYWILRSLIRTWRLRQFSSGQAIRALAGIVIVTSPAIGLAANLRYNNRHRFRIAEDYVKNIAKTIEQNGTVLTVDWQVYSPALYFREVEHYRPDIVFIDINLLRRSWYFTYLEQAYPPLIAGTRAKVDLFLEDLRHWEEDTDLYNRDRVLNQRLNSRFLDMITSFVAFQISSAPVYITQEIGIGADGQNGELTKSFNASYQLIPQGLVFELVRPGSGHLAGGDELELKGLRDSSLKFDENDVVRQKVIPAYANMITNRGIYLAAQGRHSEAIAAFERALSIEPDYRPARRGLDSSQSSLQKLKQD